MIAMSCNFRIFQHKTNMATVAQIFLIKNSLRQMQSTIVRYSMIWVFIPE